MADDIKHMDIAEFQSLGFLQEANRLFFHPHGLALQITTVKDEPGTWRSVILGEPELEAVRALLAGEQISDEERDAISQRIDEGNDYRPGDKWISGIWDYRDDPEGVVFGSGGYGDSAERAAIVKAERLKHAAHRAVLFGFDVESGVSNPAALAVEGGLDVEPLDWTQSEDGE